MDTAEDLVFPHARSRPLTADISSIKQRILDIGNEINSFKYEEAQNQVFTQLVQRRENYASYISPLRCLPPEITEIIIHNCLMIGVQLLTVTQICGTIRDIVHQVPVFWSRVGLSRFNSYRYNTFEGICCKTTEQLNYVLTHAASRPLDLTLHLDTFPEILEYTRIHQHLINSLTLNGNQSFQTIHWSRLDALDLSQMRRLRLMELDQDEFEKIMNLAMKSQQDEIEVQVVWPWGSMDTWIRHNFLRRVTLLELTDADIEAFKGQRVSFPRLRSLDIKGSEDLLRWIDAQNLKTLEFRAAITRISFNITILPDSLTKMTLRRVNFNSTTMFAENPHSLPSLVSLGLERGDIHGPLQMYFTTPKLEDLSLKRVKFYPLKEDARYEVKVDEGTFTQLLLDMLDCEIYANLKTLSLSRMNIPKNFVMKIRSYVELWRLDMSEIAIEDFVPSFVEHLEDFPSLRELHIPRSWPHLMVMSYKEFVEQCALKRPRMNIYLKSSEGII